MLKRKAKRIRRARQPGKNKLGFGYEMPPDYLQVQIYFNQKGMEEQAHAFYQYYDNLYWQSPQGTPYRNWKVLATDWIFDYEQEQKLKKRQWQNRFSHNL